MATELVLDEVVETTELVRVELAVEVADVETVGRQLHALLTRLAIAPVHADANAEGIALVAVTVAVV